MTKYSALISVRGSKMRALIVCIIWWVIPWTLVGYESPKSLKIAICNWDIVEKQSDAREKFRLKFNQSLSEFQNEIRTKEAEIRKTDDELQKKRTTISASDYSKQQEAIQKEIIALNKKFDKKRQQFDALFSLSIAELRQNIQKVAREIAKKYNIDLVLNMHDGENNIILLDDNLELTGEILNALNYQYKEIPWRNVEDIKITDGEVKNLVPLNNKLINQKIIIK